MDFEAKAKAYCYCGGQPCDHYQAYLAGAREAYEQWRHATMTYDSEAKPNMVIVPGGEYYYAIFDTEGKHLVLRASAHPENADICLPHRGLYAVYGRNKDSLTVEKLVN